MGLMRSGARDWGLGTRDSGLGTRRRAQLAHRAFDLAPSRTILSQRCERFFRFPNPESRAMDADLLRIPVGPGSMHVERYGHGGAPILLVHGFGTCSFLWREIGPVLALA